MKKETLKETKPVDAHENATFSSIGVLTLVFLLVVSFKLISESVKDVRNNFKEKGITSDMILSSIFALTMLVVVLTGIAGFLYCIKEIF